VTTHIQRNVSLPTTHTPVLRVVPTPQKIQRYFGVDDLMFQFYVLKTNSTAYLPHALPPMFLLAT
jgi:hypothetical protein